MQIKAVTIKHNLDTELSTLLFDNQVTAILLLDTKCDIHYANLAAEQLFALRRLRLITYPLSYFFQQDENALKTITLPLTTGESVTNSEATITVNNTSILTELTSSPIKIDNSLYLLIEMREIERQRRLFQENYQYIQQKVAKDLIRNLAHEIKNPLGGVRGAAQLLQRMLQDKSLHEYTQVIIEQADRLKNLVDRLLGPQRLGVRKASNIHVLLEKVRLLIELTPNNHITLIRDYDPSIPEIYADPEQIEQAILNISNNAVEALQNQKRASIILRTRTEHNVIIHEQHHRLVLKIEIIDDGPGIPNNIQETLFYPMVSARDGGTGLGLSISQNLIDQHNGKIEVISQVGSTNFTIYLPIESSIAVSDKSNQMEKNNE